MRLIMVLAVLILLLSGTTAGALEPTLTLTETRRGTWDFTGMLDPPVTLEDQVGCGSIPYNFEWEAQANGPGTSVTEFRYGWDIVDPDDPLQWDIDWTNTYQASPRTFYFGTHTFMIEARDDTGAITRGTVICNIVNTSAPALTVTEDTRGEWEFVGLDGPVVSLVDPVTNPVTPWWFDWDGLSCYPVSVVTYRHGWDITDPDDDNQWSPWGDIRNAGPREFLAGVHNFMVEVKDDQGEVTRATIVFEVVPGSSPVKESTWGRIKSMYPETD